MNLNMYYREKIKTQELTINAFAKLDDIAQLHGLMIFCSEMRKNTWTKGNIFIQIQLCETITTEFKFRWINISQVGVENTKRIKLSNMMTAYLISTN